MARYAVPRPGCRTLDPACGAGALLAAAQERGALTTGIDADPAATAIAASVLGPKARVVQADFLDLDPDEAPFDAVLVNPPYLRQEAIGKRRKAYLRERFAHVLASSGSGRLDLLGYFLLHLDRFLRSGGRLAFLSSAAWLTSGYGRVIRTFLADHYRLDRVLESVVEPWFPEARTRAVLVLARKDGDVPADHPVVFQRLLRPLDPRGVRSDGRSVAAGQLCRGEPWGEHLRTAGALDALRSTKPAAWSPLSDHATARFGLKTGADRFFVLRDGLDGAGQSWPGDRSALQRIVLSPMEIGGIDLVASDLRRHVLVLDPDADGDPAVSRHLRRAERQSLHDRPTCRARERKDGHGRWFCLQPGPPPPVIWARTEQYRHLVASNADGVVVNNNLIGLWPRPPITAHGLLVSLNSGWTFLLRYAHGRVSNEGKVKTEVGDLKRFCILDPTRLEGVSLEPLRGRRIGQLQDELQRHDRQAFERDVLVALGLPHDDAAAWVERLTIDVTRIIEQEKAWERRYRRGKYAARPGVVRRRSE